MRVAELPPAVASAVEELHRRRLRFEVYLRAGETVQVRRQAAGRGERRVGHEVGVACRVAGDGRVGFGAAAGGGARAGRDAALGALASLLPGADPLPPREALGCTEAPPPPAPATPGEVERFAAAVLAALPRRSSQPEVAELRVLDGRSTAVLVTAEGFTARTAAAGASVELLVAPEAGPWRLVRSAARELSALDPAGLAARALAAARFAPSGERPERALADVLLEPEVAAPLLVALARHLLRAGQSDPTAGRARVSALWRLTDERAGPGGWFPTTCDGEGVPARTITLLAGGRLVERLAVWSDAASGRGAAGGAVRPSYRVPPVAGPANLVATGPAPLPSASLLGELGQGYLLACPAGTVRVDEERATFALRAAAAGVQAGRVVSTHPLVELRGSFRRLLAGLAATGDAPECFALECAVTTPALLFRRLEIA